MQALKSPMIRSIWYIIWLILVIISQQMEQFCLNAKGLDSVRVVFFLIIAILTLLFMLQRYQHEQHYFKTVNTSLSQGLTEFFGLVVFILVAIGCFMIIISYLKARGYFPHLVNRTDYLDRGSLAFWFDLLASSLLISLEQQFVTIGFFFNYFFRRNSLIGALVAILISGLIFGALNMESWHLINFFIYTAIGLMLATIYLATQNLQICMFMSVFVAIMKVILI